MTREPVVAIDLFAGPLPGGWDVAAVELGLDPLGVEWDDAACRVREAAGLRTLQADVAALDPEDFPCDLLIASPPCTAFSMAGKGEGRRALDTLLAAVRSMGAGASINKEALDEACSDETAHLVLEPLRWALALSPRLICCEQVPPALPVWEAMEPILRERGYWTWSGVLSAEQFGVPQTRKRAFLIASLDGPVSMPAPTHQRYVAPRSRDDIGGGLFDLPEPERIVAPGDGDLLPWVSMAEALGWVDGPASSPAPTATSGGAETGGVEVGRSVRTSFGEPHRGPEAGSPAPEFDPDERPSRTIVGKTGDWQLVNPYRPNSAEGLAKGRDVWTIERPAPTIVTTRRSDEGVLVGRQLPPGEGRNVGGRDWIDGRPATTVTGDQRLGTPTSDRANGRESAAKGPDAVRVSIEQAACLQSFPAGHPWEAAGSRSAAFRCIGNAVCPPLAIAVIGEALGVDWRTAHASYLRGGRAEAA